MIMWWVCVWWLWGECADRRNRPRGQCCIWLRNWKCRGTAVQMMDRTGAWERWGRGGGGERGGTCWSAFYTHLGEIERKSIWLRSRRIYDLIRLDGWTLPAPCDIFLLLFISDIWYSPSSRCRKTLAAMMCTSKATDGQKCDILQQQAADVYSNTGRTPSTRKGIDTASVYLSYELYSLLWRYLRVSDQHFPGRHRELSDW